MPASPASPPVSTPHGFAGRFERDPEVLRAYSSASGPFAMTPLAVAAPRDADDVQRLVSWARETGTPLITRGAGTGMPGGNVGRGVTVDMARHFRAIGAVDAHERVLRVKGGVTLAEVDRAARAVGLFLPALPSSAKRCTVGGAVANNAAGARTFGYGAVRDWVEALTITLGTGDEVHLGADGPDPPLLDALSTRLADTRQAILDGWPGVCKNSSGYALDRFLGDGPGLQLLVGSEGTLGIVTEVTVRLAKIPEHTVLALVRTRSLEDVDGLASLAREIQADTCEFFGRRFLELAARALGPEIDPSETEALLLIEVSGSRETTRAARDRIDDSASALGARVSWASTDSERSRVWSVRHGASPAIARAAEQGTVSTQFMEDSVVPPERLTAYVRGVDDILDGVGFDRVVFGHAGDGNVHVNPLVPLRESDARARVREALEQTVDLVSSLGGTLSGEHGDGRLRAPLLDRIWSEPAVAAFRRVKESLDPYGVLNPGVILPLPDQDPLDGLWGDERSPAAPAVP